MDTSILYLILTVVCAPLLPLIPMVIQKLLMKTLDPKVRKLLEDEQKN